MNLLEGLKTGRPGMSLLALQSVVDAGMVDPKGTGLDLYTLFERLSVNLGLNYIVQVNDCEDSGDWTESDDGTFDKTTDSSYNRVGSNNLKLRTTGATDGTQYVQTLFIDESAKIPKSLSHVSQQDWRDTKYLGFWKHAESSAHFGADGELQVGIVNNGTLQTVQDVDGTNATEHHWCQIDMDAAGWSRDKVESLRFYGNNSAVEDTYIDDIIRYQIQFNGGPLYGGAFPIKSGTTLNENHWAQWTINGLVASSSADIADLGPTWLGESSRTGTAKRSKWAMLPGRFIFLIQVNAATTAGEGLEWVANGRSVGVTASEEEESWAKGLEAGGEAYDHIFAMYDTGGRNMD